MSEYLAALDSPAALTVLTLIAYFDAVIGIGIFVVGEVAFLAAGAGITATGTWLPAAFVLLAAWLGDMTSFYLGRRFGGRLVVRILNRAKRRRVWRKAQSALKKHGAGFVVIARLLGPVSWLTPFLAGTLGMKRRVFALAAALGVGIGVGMFLLYGAIGQHVIEIVWPFLLDHFAALGLGAAMMIASVVVWRQSKGAAWYKATKAGAVSTTIFLSTNFLYFFVLDTHGASASTDQAVSSVCQAAEGPFLVSAGDTALHLPQPVNVILLSDGTGADLMQELGWHQNLTFTHDQIGFGQYLRSLVQRTPPVSELYLEKYPADSAFQMPGTLKTREHIRWWNRGAGVHFGAISRDDEIAVKYYGHLPVILHDIDPKVDATRRLLAELVLGAERYTILGIAPLSRKVSEGENSDFGTDGGVLVLTEHGKNVSEDILSCFKLEREPPIDREASLAART
ncbi:MAG: LssY C-terminal domain-containing protein [Pseudomonadota bacterium]